MSASKFKTFGQCFTHWLGNPQFNYTITAFILHIIICTSSNTFQEPLCTSSELECVKKISIISDCLKPCSGLYVTGFAKSEQNKHFEGLFPIFGPYNEYKKLTTYPTGKYRSNAAVYKMYFIGYEWKNQLRFVRIYFDTPTFNTIEKDRAAKFVDYVSAIGGTMGLLTGFSIISGVEILYYASTIICSFLKKKNL